MITIENAKLIVTGFNADLNKLNFDINNQIIEDAEKLVSALKLFKYMTKNNLNKIDGSYYINPKSDSKNKRYSYEYLLFFIIILYFLV